MTETAAHHQSAGQNFTSLGVAETVALATVGDRLAGAASLTALGIARELVAGDVRDAGRSALIARELAELDSDGWTPRGEAAAIAHVLSAARRWVTLSFTRGDEPLDGVVLVIAEDHAIMAVPRALLTFRFAGLDAEGDLPAAIVDLIVGHLDQVEQARVVLEFTMLPGVQGRTMVARLPEAGSDAIELSDGVIASDGTEPFVGVLDAAGVAERIESALRLGSREPDEQLAQLEGRIGGAIDEAEEEGR